MRITNGTCILVTDGSKMLLFRNEGDADYPKLTRVAKTEDEPRGRAVSNCAMGPTGGAGTSSLSLLFGLALLGLVFRRRV